MWWTDSAKPKSYTRTHACLRWLGIDLITVRGADAVRQAIESGDLERASAVSDRLDDLPWFLRRFFRFSRFFSSAHGWFLPFRSETHPSYAPCAAFLTRKFVKESPDVSEQVTRSADMLVDGGEHSDRELSAPFIDALFSRFAGSHSTPASLVRDAERQLFVPLDSFLPHRVWPARRAVPAVYAHAEACLRSTGELPGLPSEAATDVGHAVFALRRHAATVLRHLRNNVDEDAGTAFARIALGRQLFRFAVRGGTLGGLLPDTDPAIANRTIVLLDIRSAALETGDIAWAFGTGDSHRRCLAEKPVVDFYKAVQFELQKRRNTK